MAALHAAPATAQEATAKIVGTVTDQQGAVVPGVKINVTNKATNVTNSTTSGKDGFYQVLDLPIGTYHLVARRSGFRTAEATTTRLEINQSLRMDFHLEVGSVNEQVTVEGQGTGVETVNPTLGQSVTERPIVNMPLNGRDVLTLALLQPGVTDDNPDDTSASHGFNIAGGRTDSITYLLDGGLNNDLIDNGAVLDPNPDAIAEFRILTSNYTAEYGRNGAGIISVVTKSGTNKFHGSAFDFVRNTDFDANAYFNIQQGIPRNNLKRNQFGGTFGGPIVKDRLFFFVSYQGQRQVATDNQPEQTVFTTAELNGDFSHAVADGSFTVNSNEAQDGPTCSNPAGCPDTNVANFLQTNPFFQPDPAKQAQAIIDPSTFDPAAKAYIATGLVPSSGTGTLFPTGTGKDNTNEVTGKIDFDISSKDKLSATVGGIRNPLLQPFAEFLGETSTVAGFPDTDQNNSYFLNLAYTRTFSTSQLNELRATGQRRTSIGNKPVTNMPTIPQFGIASDLPNGPPFMTFDNGLAFGPDQAGPSYFAGNTYAISDTFTWVKGRNTWKFGGGYSEYQQNTLFGFFTDSNFSFVGYAAGGDGTGNSFADFLIGNPNNLFEGPNARNNIRTKSTYGFAQDEWRVRPNLTLTLGLRYEYSSPKTDTEGRTFSIIPGDQSTRFPNAPLGLVFPGDPGAPRGVNFPDRDNFAPRIGFAWSPGSRGKTSVRGGFGIFYDVLKGEDNLQFNGAPPFYSEPFVTFPCTPSALNADCPTPANSPFNAALPFYSNPWATSTTPIVPNPFPSQPPNPATAFSTATGDFLPFGGGSIFFVEPHLHTPYDYQYNLSVQQAVAKTTVFELNYVGSSSKGLTSLVDVNPFDLSTVVGPNANPTRILNENQNAALTAFCLANDGGSAICPLSSALSFANISFASFNSMEASLTKQNGNNRIIGNTYFTLAYTWGHSIDNASGFRERDDEVSFYNHSQFRGDSDFDVRNRITFSGGWDIPFERAWSSGANWFVSRVLKGWSLYPIFSWRNGFPLSINSELPVNPGTPGPSGAGDGFLANADFAPGFNRITIFNPRHTGSCTNPNTGAVDTGNLYFNCSAFVALADTPNFSDPYGNTPRDFFRGPGRTNLDLALAKTTPISERVNVELRLEAFNVFNHAEFANPDTNLASATFGQITSTTLGTGVTALQTQRIVQVAGRLTF
jgi:outer membrane receptor protein involved in Fe transport